MLINGCHGNISDQMCMWFYESIIETATKVLKEHIADPKKNCHAYTEYLSPFCASWMTRER